MSMAVDILLKVSERLDQLIIRPDIWGRRKVLVVLLDLVLCHLLYDIENEIRATSLGKVSPWKIHIFRTVWMTAIGCISARVCDHTCRTGSSVPSTRIALMSDSLDGIAILFAIQFIVGAKSW
jgi:hypothetical protein